MVIACGLNGQLHSALRAAAALRTREEKAGGRRRSCCCKHSHLCFIHASTDTPRYRPTQHGSLLQLDDFFVPPLAFCCKIMNSRMSLAVRQGFSITTE
ncbi:hypothetical protein FQA47_011853 [Oryzias melastigma]|uniref:Uncharacterized protein n=1 Tax=Oryzias melastigma TaxID=30732 RepID=A0A834CEM7_ORYME|nr:hypothetical protein FQA47_011853 [Oryzias melastigma]